MNFFRFLKAFFISARCFRSFLWLSTWESTLKSNFSIILATIYPIIVIFAEIVCRRLKDRKPIFLYFSIHLLLNWKVWYSLKRGTFRGRLETFNHCRFFKNLTIWFFNYWMTAWKKKEILLSIFTLWKTTKKILKFCLHCQVQGLSGVFMVVIFWNREDFFNRTHLFSHRVSSFIATINHTIPFCFQKTNF